MVGNESASRVTRAAGILVFMNDYIIGAGAVLTAGPSASFAGATLHAQTDPAIAGVVRAAVVDFESSSLADLSKLVVLATGWSARDVRAELLPPLVARGTCTLADVIEALSRAAKIDEVHVFARWMPDELMAETLRRAGVTLIAHPLGAIRQAALVCGQGVTHLRAPVRAA